MKNVYSNECDLLVGVCKGVLIHGASSLLIFLPEAREVFPPFSEAFGVFSIFFQEDGH